MFNKRFRKVEGMWTGTNRRMFLQKMGVESYLKFPDVKQKEAKDEDGRKKKGYIFEK